MNFSQCKQINLLCLSYSDYKRTTSYLFAATSPPSRQVCPRSSCFRLLYDGGRLLYASDSTRWLVNYATEAPANCDSTTSSTTNFFHSLSAERVITSNIKLSSKQICFLQIRHSISAVFPVFSFCQKITTLYHLIYY